MKEVRVVPADVHGVTLSQATWERGMLVERLSVFRQTGNPWSWALSFDNKWILSLTQDLCLKNFEVIFKKMNTELLGFVGGPSWAAQ